MSRKVIIEEIDAALYAVRSELLYQNSLPRRTDDEAKDVAGFLTLIRRYVRSAEDNWADNPGELQEDGTVQVPTALHDMRKIAAIAVRAMIYNGVRNREQA